MNYWKKDKLLLLLSLGIGLTIALVTRFSFFASREYFSFYKIGGFIEYRSQGELFGPVVTTSQFVGTKVTGSGFPFRAYSECSMEFRGTVLQPTCYQQSLVWEFSIVLNTIFWGSIFLLFFVLLRLIFKPIHK